MAVRQAASQEGPLRGSLSPAMLDKTCNSKTQRYIRGPKAMDTTLSALQLSFLSSHYPGFCCPRLRKTGADDAALLAYTAANLRLLSNERFGFRGIGSLTIVIQINPAIIPVERSASTQPSAHTMQYNGRVPLGISCWNYVRYGYAHTVGNLYRP